MIYITFFNLISLVNFLDFLIRKHKTSIKSYTKLLIETLLNINILPFKNWVVELILELFSMATDLMLQEYFLSKLIKLLTFWLVNASLFLSTKSTNFALFFSSFIAQIFLLLLIVVISLFSLFVIWFHKIYLLYLVLTIYH